MRSRIAGTMVLAGRAGLLAIFAALVWVSVADAKAVKCKKTFFPATGQTTSETAGDDGDIEAGATLNYTDNGDGTITDNNTRLMWEKKNSAGGGANSANLHDADNEYTWDATNTGFDSIWVWLGAVNSEGGTGFAGYSDWRIPNVKELFSIIDYGRSTPAADPAFGDALCCWPGFADAVLYWSSTTPFALLNAFPPVRETVQFNVGGVEGRQSIASHFVRAVRGGCLD